MVLYRRHSLTNCMKKYPQNMRIFEWKDGSAQESDNLPERQAFSKQGFVASLRG
jgi:hypothetical protein